MGRYSVNSSMNATVKVEMAKIELKEGKELK